MVLSPILCVDIDIDERSYLKPCRVPLSQYKDPNTTNLHTHGLHISSNSPGDNVFHVVEPGTEFTYQYDLPDDHAGGTFWYHAHHHGSTALQVGGGMAGVMIVEDEEGDVPSQVKCRPFSATT